METQKIVNLLNDSSNMPQTVKQQKVNTSKVTIKFEIETIKSGNCDYSNEIILVTGNITVTADNNTDVAYKNFAPFSTCTTKIIDVFVDEANHIYIAIPMYNFIEYSVIIQIHQEVYGSLKEMKFLLIMLI